ncbi:NaeI family type II restriction endonuclease [Streptomyces phaeochromogenes]|uniref:NaeI family type II restriction endonuclease n=1 Tax=Streptomyces phaeochromogenes TaxID=1923 RepID=UPI00225212D4|nr:NaeI family type II restriction endonuclease [Streptomyces phaeochromogenes]MCX5596525.1 NaeI family type II restriction endonuclease [Streptomyces phaeochromogenes]
MLPIEITAASNITLSEASRRDTEITTVRDRLLQLDPDGRRFASVLRNTIDQLLNGEATGRYDWSTLFKTEKTHAGTLVEINLQREFMFDDGDATDYRIAGIQVDCKYSQRFGMWMIPPEAQGHLCLLVWADDRLSRWSAGLLRIEQEWLNGGTNRDMKFTVKAKHRDKIIWIWRDAELPENVLLHLDEATRKRILIPGKNKGQARVRELFRHVHGKRISRGVVRTAAQQLDYMARVREGDKGRARPALRSEGIIILGDYQSHQAVARALGGPVPDEGEFVAHRVARARPEHHDRPQAAIDGDYWVIARPGEDADPAPRLPEAQESRARAVSP